MLKVRFFNRWIEVWNGSLYLTKTFFRHITSVFGLDTNFIDVIFSKDIDLSSMIVFDEYFSYFRNKRAAPSLSGVLTGVYEIDPVSFD